MTDFIHDLIIAGTAPLFGAILPAPSGLPNDLNILNIHPKTRAKQMAAGLLADVPGGAIMLPGFTGSLGESLAAGMNAPLPDISAQDTALMRTQPISSKIIGAILDLPETFPTAMKEGWDEKLISAGTDYIKGYNEMFDTPWPKGTGDQIARLMGNAFPLPVPRLPPGSNLALQTLYHSANILAPTVMAGKGMIPRAAAQVGIMTGVDQGVRALLDNPELPLMFSDEALGIRPDLPKQFQGEYPRSPVVPSIDVGDGTTDDWWYGTELMSALNPVTSAMAGNVISLADHPLVTQNQMTFVPLPTGEKDLGLLVSPEVANQRMQEIDRKVQRADDWERAKNLLLIGGLFLTGYGVAKWKQGIGIKQAASKSASEKLVETASTHKLAQFFSDLDPARALPPASRLFRDSTDKIGPKAYIRSLPGTSKEGIQDAWRFFSERQIDATNAVRNALSKQGIDESIVHPLVRDLRNDPMTAASDVHHTGRFGHGFQGGYISGNPGGGNTHSIADLAHEVNALGAVRVPGPRGGSLSLRSVFNATAVAQAIRRRRYLSGTTVTIAGKTKGMDELDRIIEFGRDIPEVRRLLDKFGEVYRSHLEFRNYMGVLDDAQLQKLLADAVDFDGNYVYMHLTDAPTPDLLNSMWRALGGTSIYGTERRQLLTMAEMHSASAKGIADPLSPIESLNLYSIHSMDDAVRQSRRSSVMQQAAAIDYHVDGKRVTRHTTTTKGEKTGAITVRRAQTARDTTYIGKGEIIDGTDIETTPIRVDSDAPSEWTSGSVADIRSKNPNEIRTAIENGEIMMYHVPDAGMRAGIDMHPDMLHTFGGRLDRFGKHWVTMLTQFITGKYSLFAFPFGHLYNTGQVASNAFGKQGIRAGLGAIPRGVRGSARLLVEQGSGVIAEHLAQRIAKNFHLGERSSDKVIKLQRRLEQVYRDSMHMRAVGVTGKSTTGINSNIFTGTVDDLAAQHGVRFTKFFGAKEMGLIRNMWEVFVNAMHEGPAYAAMLHHVGSVRKAGLEVTDDVINEGNDIARNLAGDMRAMGSSGLAKFFAATTPFARPFIQAPRSAFAAFLAGKTAGQKFKSFSKYGLGIATLVGIPAATELFYTFQLSQGIDPDTGEPYIFPDPSGNGKMWTYNDYYWNGYTTDQRVRNIIMMIPGIPPWEATLIPQSPELSFYRGAIIDSIDAVFNLSDVGALATANAPDPYTGAITEHVTRNHWVAGGAILTDLPLFPPLAAALSLMDVDVRIGIDIEEQDDPNDPESQMTVLRALPTGRGERYTRNSGQNRYVGQEVKARVANALQDIFGHAATLGVNMYEGYERGKGKDADVVEGVKEAFGEAADVVRTQARWGQSIWGRVARPSASGEITTSLYNSRQALDRLSKDAASYFSGGKISAGGEPTIGEDIPPDDPINYELSADANNVKAAVAIHDKEIATLRRQIAFVGNSPTIDGKPANSQQRRDVIDGNNLRIQELKAMQMATILQYEKRIEEVLYERYGRVIEINLSTFVPRSDLVGSSLDKELKKPLRIDILTPRGD